MALEALELKFIDITAFAAFNLYVMGFLLKTETGYKQGAITLDTTNMNGILVGFIA